MRKIEMVDLKAQYSKIKDPINKAIQEVIDSSAFIKGPDVNLFATELSDYLKVKHAIPCANGTDALQVSLMALNLKPEDEVITPDFTFVSTAEVISLLGFKTVFADVDPNTFTISLDHIKSLITPKTKAIVPVHLFGQCAQMEELMQLANQYNLQIIEDAAQALGSEYHFTDGNVLKAGTIGNIGITSFFPSKNLGCYGDGGAIFTNDDDVAENLKAICNHGMHIRYNYDRLGVNSRLDTIQAAILRIKLAQLDQYNLSRKKAADFYDHAFSGHPNLKIPARNLHSTHTFHQYTLILQNIDRTELQTYLKSKGIPTMVYYPFPLHLQKAYAYLGYREGDFPVTEYLCKSVISLPMHSELDEEQLQYITETILEYVNLHEQSHQTKY
jgi:UDP-2-acetamido-2-deoxy-ribo-hexuluronate aminotransferase